MYRSKYTYTRNHQDGGFDIQYVSGIAIIDSVKEKIKKLPKDGYAVICFQMNNFDVIMLQLEDNGDGKGILRFDLNLIHC